MKKAEDEAIRTLKPPLNNDLDSMTPQQREVALKRVGAEMDNKALRAAGLDPNTLTSDERQAALDKIRSYGGIVNESAGTSFRNQILGEITDGLHNLGSALGISNRQVTGATGFVDKDGNFHPRTCFVAGTLVTKLKVEYYEKARNGSLTSDARYEEKVAIETVKSGDYVLSFDEVKKEKSYKKVTDTFVRKTELIYTVSFVNGEKLETTEEHPFYIKDKGWVAVKNLAAGDLSITANDDLLEIQNIEFENNIETVYNFEVEDNHTYFVGRISVLVHNKCVIEGDSAEKKLIFDNLKALVSEDFKLSLKPNGEVVLEDKRKDKTKFKNEADEMMYTLLNDPNKPLNIKLANLRDKPSRHLGDTTAINPSASGWISDNEGGLKKNEEGSGSNILLDRSLFNETHGIYSVAILDKNGKIKNKDIFESEAKQVVLIHELVHAYRNIVGMAYNSFTSNLRTEGFFTKFIGANGKTEFRPIDPEEAEASGIQYYTTNDNGKREKATPLFSRINQSIITKIILGYRTGSYGVNSYDKK